MKKRVPTHEEDIEFLKALAQSVPGYTPLKAAALAELAIKHGITFPHVGRRHALTRRRAAVLIGYCMRRVFGSAEWLVIPGDCITRKITLDPAPDGATTFINKVYEFQR